MERAPKREEGMITAYLQGGMGNQLFQYAMALSQAVRLKTGLQLDGTTFAADPQRIFSLYLWEGITEAVVYKSQPNVFHNDHKPFDAAQLAAIKDGDVLYGYWQSHLYFADIRTRLLLPRLRPAEKLTDAGFRNLQTILNVGKRSTFLTVRRGDYLSPGSVCATPPSAYYFQACKYIADRVENPAFFVFSDEPEWCKKNLDLPFDIRVIGSYNQTSKHGLGREDEDLWLMSRCQNAVMAASSYSWWGVYLNPTDESERIILRPKVWFNSFGPNGDNVTPDSWIKL